MKTSLLAAAAAVFSLLTATTLAASRPHIVMIVADDLGWADVGWRDPDMVTPNLDSLVSEGVNLTNAYVQPLCSPSRAAFLSGKYPFKIGMQDSVLSARNNVSLPLGLTLLPERLQALGYSTHLVGKWHLGFCSWNMTPTYRGFDSFYGMYLGKGGYYDHESGSGANGGYDFHDNETTAWSAAGTYSTHLFTDRAIEVLQNHDPMTEPLFLIVSYQAVHSEQEVPDSYVSQTRCSQLSDYDRQMHCAMTAAMDEGIGNITDALVSLGYEAEDLLLFFTTDNGGMPSLGSSNWPLRGGKSTLWEGGTRAVSFLHSKNLLPNAPYTWDGLVHAVDWYPTLLSAAGDNSALTDIDGLNLWTRIKNNTKSLRNEIVYNINEVSNNSAIRQGWFKLIFNRPGNPDGWYNPPTGQTEPDEPTGPYPTYELFNLNTDPYETTDVKDNNDKTKEVTATLISRLAELELERVDAEEGVQSDESLPSNFGGVWYPGWC